MGWRPSEKEWLGCAAWRRFRKMILASEPLCRMCKQPATQVDHIIDRIIRPDLALDPENCQPLCGDCHAKKTGNAKSLTSKDIKVRRAI